ncbi:MAG: ATP cone domain-containing protein [archaeon]
MVMIKKNDGTLAEFDIGKVKQTLERLDTNSKVVNDALKAVKAKVREGMTTREIYNIVFNILKKEQHVVASKYSLKNAIVDLGPKGFNFEDFTCRILQEKGYDTEIRQLLNGEVITHETDVIATKKTTANTGTPYVCMAVECKFHSQPWTYCPIQTALYVYARFLDIQEGYELGREKRKVTTMMIATNTRFSSEVIRYAQSKDILLISWDYPKGQGIKDIVDKKGLYPITVLTTLSKHEKTMLMKKGILLVKDINEKDVKPAVMKEVSEFLKSV